MIPENEYDPYYKRYIQPLENNGKSIIENLHKSFEELEAFLKDLPETKYNFSYAEGKWTIKEVLQHIIDTERVFNFRALCFARQNDADLPGFDQDEYVASSNASEKEFSAILEEFKLVRFNSILLFNSFTDNDLKKLGKASGAKMSVRAIGCILTGHQNHHINVLKEKYL